MIGNPSYPTYQVFLALFVSAMLTAAFMPLWIKLLRYRKIGQQVRADGPLGHLVKQGTPTMGGVVMLIMVLVTCAFFARWSSDLTIAVVATMLTGLLGFIDDASKVAYERFLGLKPKAKLFAQALISVVFCVVATNNLNISPALRFPGIDFTLHLDGLCTSIWGLNFYWLYIIFVFLLMAGFSNAVNLTDGLDGLASGAVLVVMVVMAMIAFRYNEINLAIFAAACGGSCVGFLWYNCFPADIFMGDTGSLALGTAFAAVAVLTNTEVISLVIGAVFIAEALSVIVQVASFKLTGKRVFLMAPIHHHYEKKGWSETKVVLRFWIVAAAFAALGFALYFQLN